MLLRIRRNMLPKAFKYVNQPRNLALCRFQFIAKCAYHEIPRPVLLTACQVGGESGCTSVQLTSLSPTRYP